MATKKTTSKAKAAPPKAKAVAKEPTEVVVKEPVDPAPGMPSIEVVAREVEAEKVIDTPEESEKEKVERATRSDEPVTGDQDELSEEEKVKRATGHDETFDDNEPYPERGRVFTNTRFPEVKMLTPNGTWVKFNSTKALVKDPEIATFLASVDGVFTEPDSFMQLDVNDGQFYTHKATGFKTLNRKAYEDWINRSEWSATAQR